MASSPFLKAPPHKHHVAIIALVVLLLIIFALASTVSNDLSGPQQIIIQTPKSPASKTGLATKSSIFARIAQASTEPLTADEKAAILRQIYADKVKTLGFTSDELNQVLGALND